MKKINTGSSDFSDLRKENVIYVDKTAYMRRLASDEENKVVFMSRPRRFGKSLTVSAFRALFPGRRELFKGLAIERMGWKWQTHPVIHFRFNELRTESVEAFEEDFVSYVGKQLRVAGHEYDASVSYSLNFANAIEGLHAKSLEDHKKDPEGKGVGVVILIDEYDAPVGHALGNVSKAEAIRDRMSSLYAQMKDRTGCIRFLFMTGISKFTKLSVFSALSNIVDVSQDDAYATMFGYTEEELTANFEEHLRAHAAIMGKRYEDYRAEMKRWYNGFRFAKGDPTTVYNPISVALTLKKKEAEGFTATWATTGRPSMLMNYLKREDLLALDYEKVEEVSGEAFDVAELRNLTAIALLYQAGYLTIKAYDADVDDYTLGVPDEEIRRDLSTLVAGVAAEQDVAWAANLGKSLLRFNWPKVFAGIKSLYAHLPYGPKEDDVQEFSYERVLYALLASQGIEVVTEDRQSNGRADVVAKHKKGIYIFELKVDDPVDRAFAQIREKNYAAPYLADPRPVWLVGLSFDSKTRHLVDCAAERFVEE